MKENAAERLARMKREKEVAQESNIVSQLAHENTEEQDFTELARKLEELKAQEAKAKEVGANEGYQKMTIYIRDDIAAGFKALITKQGQQKEFANQAFSDFVQKKARELGISE